MLHYATEESCNSVLIVPPSPILTVNLDSVCGIHSSALRIPWHRIEPGVRVFGGKQKMELLAVREGQGDWPLSVGFPPPHAGEWTTQHKVTGQ